MDIGLIISLIKDALTEIVTSINSIDVSGNDLIFKTATGDYTVTIPQPTLGVDKIEIENKNLKITYNDASVQTLDLSFLKGDKGDYGIIGDNLITYSLENPTLTYGGEWELIGISGSAMQEGLLIDFYENGRINFNYNIATNNNYLNIDFPVSLVDIPFIVGTGILDSMSVNIIGVKKITTTYATLNIPCSGKGCVLVQGLYKTLGSSGIGNLTDGILESLNTKIKYHWQKVG